VTTTPPTTSPLLSAPAQTLLALRAALLTRPDLDTVFALRDAGYAGGDAIYAAFEAFVRERDLIDPQQLEITHFFRRAGEFWTRAGWGETTFEERDGAFCVVRIGNCWEANADDQPDPRGCHLTVGLLGAFLGRFADYPVAVLETEGPATNSTTVEMIAGNTEMIGAFYAEHS